jgi:molecular chaperone HtpG
MKFKTEVNQLLHLIIHSLYSHPEIFLRELVSNASDALDKLKYLTLTDEKFKGISFNPEIEITIPADKEKMLIVSDNGIGMNKTDLVDCLGTIARSGTKNFLSQLSGDDRKDSSLIGQFGVGFYSAFMVADKVEVISRKAGEEEAWRWTSDGQTGFSIEEDKRDNPGTTVIMHLNEAGSEYGSRWEVEQIVKKYSNHIPFPIWMNYEGTRYEGEGDDRKEVKEPRHEQVNSASALWRRSRTEITEEEYKDFYKTISHGMDDPLLTIHTKAEGTQEYTTLFYIPSKAPFDMFNADYEPGVKLYVKRVFITDKDKELIPPYLRFVRGIIDSEDLPLNVSREILQKNKVLAHIKSASVKKILSEIQKLSEDREKYKTFTDQFNRLLKEGLYSDFGNRDTLLELIRFKSSLADGWTSLAEYKDRMKNDQKSIYYITGGNEAALKSSPLLESYKDKGFEVLLLDDDIDEIVLSAIFNYKEIPLKSVNKSGTSDEIKTDDDRKKEEELKPVVEKIKEALGAAVKDVIASSRLLESPCCIVSDEHDPTAQLQQMLKAMGQKDLPESKPILEINPAHPLVTRIQDLTDAETIKDVSWLLLDQALMVENLPVKDPAGFAARVNRYLVKALG